MKLLCADDEPDLRTILELALSIDPGLEVEIVSSGAELLERASHTRYDAFVLDGMMPGIDGYEVCRRLRDDPALDDLRIIMLTSSDDKHAAFEAGVDDYLNKDVDLLNLPNRVKLILEMH